MELRELTSLAELRACERAQCAVWGEPVPEVSIASFRAAQYAGALVAGAFEDDTLLGFAYSFPSVVEGRVGQHSHLLAVLPQERGRGVGRALKWFQRGWCLSRGVTHISWTFDPLRAKNAKLNLEHLGASVKTYVTDFYGPLGGNLNGGLPSDRLIADWALLDEAVAALALETSRPDAPKPTVARLLDQNGKPQLYDVTAERVWLELPPEFPEPDALRWRLALREAMLPLFARGYRVARFVAGGYVMTKTH